MYANFLNIMVEILPTNFDISKPNNLLILNGTPCIWSCLSMYFYHLFRLESIFSICKLHRFKDIWTLFHNGNNRPVICYIVLHQYRLQTHNIINPSKITRSPIYKFSKSHLMSFITYLQVAPKVNKIYENNK